MLRRFFAYYRPHRGLFALDFGCAIVSGLLELGFPMAIRAFVDQLLPGRDWGLILLASAVLLAVYLLNTGLTAVVVYWGHLLGINIETEMRRRAFDHLQKLSFSFYDNSKTGNLITHVTKDLEDVGEVAHHGPEDLFIAIMTFIGAFALMFAVNSRLALLTAIITPVVDGAVLALRRAHDAQLPRAVPPGGRVQRPHRGECRRHARGAGLRQRGARARAVRRRTTPSIAAPSCRPTG